MPGWRRTNTEYHRIRPKRYIYRLAIRDEKIRYSSTNKHYEDVTPYFELSVRSHFCWHSAIITVSHSFYSAENFYIIVPLVKLCMSVLVVCIEYFITFIMLKTSLLLQYKKMSYWLLVKWSLLKTNIVINSWLEICCD